jgi:hypothetical protein
MEYGVLRIGEKHFLKFRDLKALGEYLAICRIFIRHDHDYYKGDDDA